MGAVRLTSGGPPFSRRALLRRGVEGLAITVLAGASRVPADGMPIHSRERASWDINFEQAVVELPFGAYVRESFLVDGHLTVCGEGVIDGAATVSFADRTAASIRIDNNKFTSLYRGVTMLLRPDGDDVRVNGSATTLRSVSERLLFENNFTGIGSLSDRSRALIAVGALANTEMFINKLLMGQIQGRGASLERLCRLVPAPSTEIGWWHGRLGTTT